MIKFAFKDPMWTSWGPWEKCSMTCGLGHKRKYRKCEDHLTGEEAKPGLDCLGGSTELVEDCKLKDCPSKSSSKIYSICPRYLINSSQRWVDRVVELEWMQRSLRTLRDQDKEEVLREAIAAVWRQGLQGGEGGTRQMRQQPAMSRRVDSKGFSALTSTSKGESASV